ncbi:MAG: hypothetical protein FJ386_06995 [Verrucomicrobia bacterium]|nr:hypothetical protein [Verrucomicrobiota bacterium]
MAHACSIPVFRYALDRWHADPFRLELPAGFKPDDTLAKFFRNLGADSPINLDVQNRDTPGSHPRLLFPAGPSGPAPQLWEGRLTPDTLASLTDSPARREISDRILAGESAVWVLVESGNQAADDALVLRVEKRLRFLQSIAQLPRIDPSDPTSKLGPGPGLKVKFSLLRIPSANPQSEAPFLKMLAGPKPNPALTGSSWLAAVFGRGRVLGAWPAAELGDEQIEEACLFLLGACSCQVKRQNPGWDLLLHVNWDKQLAAAEQRKLEAIPAAAATPPVAEPAAAPETVTINAEPAAPATDPRPTPWLAPAAAAFVVLALLVAWRQRSGAP